jgi:hypothetical protein
MKSKLSGVALLALASGCYMKAGVVQNPRPSAEGVAISLVGEDCEDHRAGKGDPVTRDLGIKLRVDNPTDRPLKIAEAAIRLLVDGYSGGVRYPTVIEVQPHGTATLVLDFTHHALCEPERQFVVAWNDALQLGDHPLTVDNLSFHP